MFASRFRLDNRAFVLAVSAIVAIAATSAQVWFHPHRFLAFLYLFPIMLSAAYLPRWLVVLLAVSCSALAEALIPGPFLNSRWMWSAALHSVAGLLVREMVCDRRRRLQEEERLRALLDTSSEAIVCIDGQGLIDHANQPAADLLIPQGGPLIGSPIAAFLPGVHNLLLHDESPQLRTTIHCIGHRANEQVFTANVRVSTYKEGARSRFAATIAEIQQEEAAMAMGAGSSNPQLPERHEPASAFSSRETEVLRLVVQGLANKEIAAQIATTESSVKHTLQQLFAKTGVRTRGQLVRAALEQYRHLV